MAEPRSRRAMGVARLAALALLIGRSGVAHAQTADRATSLFELGIADLKLGKYETACPTLEESHRIDGNLGTLIALGDCLERWGKLHSAATRFEALIAALTRSGAAVSAHRAPQLEYAREALARLKPKIPELVLSYPTSSVPDARVLLDGVALEIDPPEQALRIDPGEHVIETQAPGRAAWRLELELDVGDRRRVPLEWGRAPEPETPPIASDAAAPGAAVAASESAPEPESERAAAQPSAARPPATELEPPTSAWRTVGWTLGGLGVAGIGVGTVAGVLVLQECPSFRCPSHAERGQHLALLTDIGFGVGLLALAGSAAVLLSTDAPGNAGDPPA
ncbi:MAG TPA: hypothetical protein VMG12_22985, partial [Polyangiaceae bacterium]|nr:hypothetical protein [Polyangiaceae bacterium]